MSMVTDVTKKIILAGLGTIDEQNEEIKDLLKRGSAVMGVGAVDNEELLYNGNREEILKRRKEREKEDNTVELGHGRSLYFNAKKDEEGNIVSRDIEFEKKPENGVREVSIEASKNADNGKKIGVHTFESKTDSDKEEIKEAEINNSNTKGGASND